MERSISESGGSILAQKLSRFGLPGPLADDLIQGRSLVQYAKRSMIFLQNSPADLLFWVEAGLVKICLPGADGSRFVVHLAGPGELLGYVSVNDSHAREVQAFEAEAFTRCSVVPITRERIRQVLSKLGLMEMIQVTEEVNAAWARIFADFVRFSGLSLRERLENVLKDLGARFGVPDARGVLLTPELSQEEFAELIGSSRPMASRVLSEMIDEGMLLKESRRYILCAPGQSGAPPSRRTPQPFGENSGRL